MTTPSREQWLRLFAAADDYHHLAPWQWMGDDEVAGVRDPGTGEITWCCVLGASGEVFGLAGYTGTTGLSVYTRVRSGKLSARSDAIRFGYPGWLASFNDRRDLDGRDRGIITSLGLRYRGQGQWPQFRVYRRGRFPWLPGEVDAGPMAAALEQAREVFERRRSTPGMLTPTRSGELLVRAIGDDGRWTDRRIKPPPVIPSVVIAPAVDAARASLLRNRVSRVGLTWEVDLFYVDCPIQPSADAPPYFPVAMLCVEPESRFILKSEVFESAEDPDERLPELVDRLLGAMEESDTIPAAIHVARPALARGLAETARLLGTTVLQTSSLRSLRQVRAQMAKMLGW